MRLPHVSIKLSTKIFLGLTGLTFAVASAGNVMLYMRASHALRDEVRGELRAVASIVASHIDPASHAGIRTQADESSQTYREIKSELAAAMKANPAIRFIHTMRPSPHPGKWTVVVDADSDPKLVSHVGDEYSSSEPQEMRRSIHMPSADEAPARDERGWFLSGYAPIRDSHGRTEAIVAVDMTLRELAAEEADLRGSALVNTLVSLLLATILSLLATRRAARLIDRFTTAAQRVRTGDLEFQLPTPGSGEIHDFATAFNEMIAGLQGSARDFLTGLYNHMHMHERLKGEIQRAGRYGHSLCVLMIDLDRFKSINDTLGHPIGDSILRQLATVLRTNLREIDIPARYGGDEFAAILPETDLDAGLAVAERLRADIEAHVFHAVPIGVLATNHSSEVSDKGMHITVTIGLACYPEHHESKDGLIMAADIALCHTKHLSRNSVGAYEHSITGDEMDPRKLYQMLHDPNGAAVASLAAAVDAKDRYTSGHSERVARFAQMIAGATNASDDVVDMLGIAGLLHDVGKIGVSDTVLNKMGGLTQEERERVQKHPSLGGDILKRAPHLDQIIPAVIFHHERWDGTGYPNGLAGERIPLMARIMAIADAFDAMTSDRPYRRAMTVEAALVELQACAGTQFDRTLVEAFIADMAAHAKKAA